MRDQECRSRASLSLNASCVEMCLSCWLFVVYVDHCRSLMGLASLLNYLKLLLNVVEEPVEYLPDTKFRFGSTKLL